MSEPASKSLSQPSPPPPAAPPPPSQSAAESAAVKPLTMRGRKRHKCMVCGNIARSRCPFFSCKGCCVKAGNACHIHVLKPSANGESVQGSPSTVPTQGGPITSTVVRHHPYDNLRLRTVRPSGLITKKEAGIINSWRFRKLRDYLEGIAAYEDEAFDRYMQNNLLLAELFNVTYLESPHGESQSLMEGSSVYERSDGVVDAATASASSRVRQRVGVKKRDAHKQRLKRAIDRSLQKLLNKGEETEDFTETEEMYLTGFAARRESKRMKVHSAEGQERLRRMEVFTSLVEKLKVVENQEDFDSCLKTYEENFVNYKALASSTSQTVALGGDSVERRESSGASDLTLNASFNARLDSFGVMKEMWRVDTGEHVFGDSISSVESL